MILIDTSVWIEFFRGREPAFGRVVRLLQDRQVLAVECVFAELLQGAKDRHERSLILEMWNSLPQAQASGTLLKAGEASGINKWSDRGVGLIDAWIVMAARTAKARIWSLDKKLLSVVDVGEIHTP